MINQILSFSKKLISLPSTKDNPQILKKVLEVALEEVKDFTPPFAKGGVTIERFEKNGVPSALIYKEKERPERFKVILNAHLDVVSGKEEQFKPYEKDGKLYGRGATDMK
ncbi:MAG: M20/M25/M40 family metallo-hydrolase, partial [Microgenomates group bacterium]